MGITGLYKILSACQEEEHLNEYRGKTVAVDMPCWIHRGAIADAQNICMGRDSKAIDKFVSKRLNQLENAGIKPICVFDGQKLPAKKLTNQKRRESRANAIKMAKECLSNGDPKAYNYFCQGITISPAINQGVRDLCLKRGLRCIVAPYEADSQLGFLSRNNIVDAVLTEDSDLFIFEATTLLTKLDDNGYCKSIKRSKIGKVPELEPFQASEQLFWLRCACIMQGCDYYPTGLKGVGIKTALKLLKNARDSGGRTLQDIMNKKLAYIPAKKFSKWEEEDIRMILKAEECFRHQLIFNTKTKNIEPLENYPDDKTGSDFAHCGNLEDHSNLETIDAHVKMDGPVKKEPVQNKMDGHLKKEPVRNKLDLSVNKEGVTSSDKI